MVWRRALTPSDPPRDTRCLWWTGFIANRAALARELSSRASSSDPELLLALYARFGEDAARLIAGSFTWILWDAVRHRLVAARDRAGVHGLYYCARGETVRLAGRVETLLRDPAVPADWNPSSIVAHVRGAAPAPGETFYAAVRALEPGELLRATRDRLSVASYWSIGPRPLLRLGSDAEYAAAFRDTFFPIVAEYLPPGAVGVTLSGGMDSTSVAAAVREVSPRTELRAFRWSAPELPDADESRYSEAVCRRLGCADVVLRADRHWPLRSDAGIRTSRASPLFSYYADLWDATYRAARENEVRCLLTGISGDNLFGCNDYAYADLLLTGRWLQLARDVRGHLRYWDTTLAHVLRGLILGPIRRSYLPLGRHRSTTPVSWLGERHRGSADQGPRPEVFPRLLPGRQRRLQLLRDRFLRYMMEPATLQAAEHGIELRHPLLDHRMFEWAARLPSSQNLRAGEDKFILRNAMRGHLPEEVIDLRGKIYPAAISRRGLQERERAKVWRMMENMRAAELGFVDEDRLRAAYRQYLVDGRNSAFWHTLTLEAWLRQHFD